MQVLGELEVKAHTECANKYAIDTAQRRWTDFYRIQKIGVEIGSYALTFGPIKIGPLLPTVCLR